MAMRPLPIRRDVHDELQREAAALRELAQTRYSEVDLLVAALREHITDLRRERDRLVAELDRSRRVEEVLQDENRRLQSQWMWRGLKPPR
jgi:hypothetical protein